MSERRDARTDADPEVTLLDRVEVMGTSIPGTRVDADDLPYNVQVATDEEIADAQASQLTDFMLRRFNGLNSNDVQGSPFQVDLTFRGFRASALPGAAQGVSVYLDGVRINEPFADIVSWDMVPEAAIRSVALMPGSNPLFGQNTLGGALVFASKSGLSNPGFEADLSYGSHDRTRLDGTYGHTWGNGLHLLAATTLFDEDGWRDASEGRTGSVFAKAGYSGESSSWDMSVLHGRSRLIGNGLLPSWRYVEAGRQPGLYEMDRHAIYTSPDVTRNRNTLATFQFDRDFSAGIGFHLLGYHRQGRRSTLNGDVSEDYEDYVEDCGDGFGSDGEPLDEDCAYTATEAARVPGGVFNTTRMRQRAGGVAANLSQQWGEHQLVYGATYDWNRVEYDQFQQPGVVGVGRAIEAIPAGVRTFFSGVRGRSRALGVFVSDLWQLAEKTSINASVRWNRVKVENMLATAEDGPLPREAFTYTKPNPALGIVHKPGAGVALFANASQNSRAPTAIELGCADPLQPCRLPTGLQADPYLEQIVSRTYELGLRWNPTRRRMLNGSVYRADNRNDILFLRAPNSQQGYFDNVDRTRYQGVDLQYQQQADAFDLYAAYSFLDATYQARGELLSGERVIKFEPGMRVAGLPRHTLKLGVQWRVTEHWAVGADAQAVSRRTASGNEDGRVANVDDETGAAVSEALRHDLSTAGYTLWNLHADWKRSARLSFHAAVNNLFDRRHETYAAIAEDMFPSGELAQPLEGPVDVGPARFVAPGAPRQFAIGMRLKF